MITRIHVNQHNLRANVKDGGDRPTITCKDYKQNRKGRVVKIHGPSRVVDAEADGITPLPCGARIWIETESEVEIVK